MKRLLLLPILFLAACTNGSLTVTNLLAGDELLPGEHATVDTNCGTYMLVDETGVSCEVDSIDLCANSSDFVITNNTCAAFREAAASKITAPTAARQ